MYQKESGELTQPLEAIVLKINTIIHKLKVKKRIVSQCSKHYHMSTEERHWSVRGKWLRRERGKAHKDQHATDLV